LWPYIAYSLWKLFETQPQRKGKISFGELRKIFFDILFREQKIVGIEKPADLYVGLLYLEILEVIRISGKTKELDERKIRIEDEKKLSEIIEKVEELPRVTGIESFEEYKQRINKGIENLSRLT